MERFAALLDRLAFEPQRNEKLRLLSDYFRHAPDPERGLALGVLTGTLDFPNAKPALLRRLVETRVDPVLFGWSYDYVGDLAETIALIWPTPAASGTAVPRLNDVVALLGGASKSEAPGVIADLLDRLDARGRWALIKMMTGGLRIGVSARLAKTAVARLGTAEADEIEDLWHGLSPPYLALFSWLEGHSARPQFSSATAFRPVMLAHALDEAEFKTLSPADFAAEWKWDGVRVQAASADGTRRLTTRTGEDIAAAFPDLIETLSFTGTLDGELLVMRDGAVGTFAELQQRLNRKTVAAKDLARYPVGLMAYDLLFEGERDLRILPFVERRARLEQMIAGLSEPRLQISPLIAFASWEALAAQRAATPHPAIEGVMLKRKASAYLPGRVTGHWYKWKRDPFLIDAVLMYAQRGHGKRSSYYSDYTFGVWQDDALVPVGKAYFGFTDAELAQIDRFVRDNTINRFGPVREVTHEREHGLVFEVAFEGLQRSPRHKSGIAMRFPRINRLRWDKPPAEADRIETLQALLDQSAVGTKPGGTL